jgi:hypothetical protein
VIAHVILFRPKVGLDDAGRARVVDALREAHASIPGIKRFAVGRRFTAGRRYDAMTRDFPFFVLFEFESDADFRAYLAHPVHEQLGQQFYLASEEAEAYDFELDEMPGAVKKLTMMSRS